MIALSLQHMCFMVTVSVATSQNTFSATTPTEIFGYSQKNFWTASSGILANTLTPIQILQLICTNTNCFYKIIIVKLLALNALSIALYTFKFSAIFIYYRTICYVMSCIENKSTQIIFKQETHSNTI